MADGEDTMDVADKPARPLAVRLALWAVTAVAIVLALWGMVHVTIPPVHPDRAAPEGHWAGSCGTCHIVSESAPLSEDD